MSVKLMVIRVSEESEKNENYKACVAMIRHIGLLKEIVSDRPAVMKLGRGCINPADGFVVVDANGQVMTNFMQLARWIDVMAVMPL